MSFMERRNAEKIAFRNGRNAEPKIESGSGTGGTPEREKKSIRERRTQFFLWNAFRNIPEK